jgi:hypothetical protein
MQRALRRAPARFALHDGVDHGTATDWGGVTRTGASGYTGVAGAFSNPLLTEPDARPRRSAVFVGLGSADAFVALGTEEDQRGDGPQADYVWWQKGHHEVVLAGFPAAPAESMYVSVWQVGGIAHFFVENETTGDYLGFSTSAPPGCSCPTAEWVDAPPRSTVELPLALYNYVVFSGAEANGAGGRTPADAGGAHDLDGRRQALVTDVTDGGAGFTIRRTGP